MQHIIDRLCERYHPLALIVYGSYANGTNGLHSDFDALIITADGPQRHDTGVVDGVQLDVFVYPSAYFFGEVDCDEFVQLFDGRIVLDTDGMAANLQKRVLRHVATHCVKPVDAAIEGIAWCRKMLLRAERADAEGLYRRHWLLVDSLEICCDVLQHPYFGPKKSLQWLKTDHPETYRLYDAALRGAEPSSLRCWIEHIDRLAQIIREGGETCAASFSE